MESVMEMKHRSPAHNVMAAAALAICALSTSDSAMARTGTPWITESAERQLIVEWQRDTGDLPLLAEEVVEAVERPGESDESLEILRTLGDPAFAALLVDRTIPVERVRELDRTDPEIRILQFVLVTYRTETETARALESLRRNPRIRSVDPNLLLRYAISPTDPIYANVSSDQRRYQWGPQANNALVPVPAPDRGLQAAWDKVRGNAYVAVLDNGVQIDPALHPDLTQNVRTQFSRNYFSADPNAIDEMAGVPQSPGFAGHGTHVAGIIAANTTNPVSLPGYPNPPSAGGAGVCWFCSLMVFRVTAPQSGSLPAPSMANTAAALTRAAQIGAQVVNISFGRAISDCSFDGDNQAVCTALAVAFNRGVAVSAAVGNAITVGSTCITSVLDFPANVQTVSFPPGTANPNVIPVGAATRQLDTSVSPSRPVRWIESGLPNTQSNCSQDFTNSGIMAPGAVIASTFYSGRNWNAGLGCGDSPFLGVEPPTYDDLLGTGYGRCTGTSMATPFVTGVVALMRTIEPRRNTTLVSSDLRQAASNVANPSDEIGAGMVNANAAVDRVLDSAGNRLTPLFAFNSNTWGDRFYTVVPQMGSAAVKDTMALRNPIFKAILPYATVGNIILYYDYPTGDATPINAKAQVWVFSTHVNPFGGQELRPLLRYSYACYDTANYPVTRAICGTNRVENIHIDHAYASNTADGDALVAGGYRLDGIEGYLLPNEASKRSNPLLRARNPAIDDWAVFPDTEQAAMAALGYTDGVSILGYAYRNLSLTQPPL